MRNAGWALGGLFVLFASYVLSVGPAFWLVNHDQLDFRVCTACYDPLVKGADALGLIPLLRWYSALWR